MSLTHGPQKYAPRKPSRYRYGGILTAVSPRCKVRTCPGVTWCARGQFSWCQRRTRVGYYDYIRRGEGREKESRRVVLCRPVGPRSHRGSCAAKGRGGAKGSRGDGPTGPANEGVTAGPATLGMGAVARWPEGRLPLAPPWPRLRRGWPRQNWQQGPRGWCYKCRDVVTARGPARGRLREGFRDLVVFQLSLGRVRLCVHGMDSPHRLRAVRSLRSFGASPAPSLATGQRLWCPRTSLGSAVGPS